MDKPESEMTIDELLAEARRLQLRSSEIPPERFREWVAITQEALRFMKLAEERGWKMPGSCQKT